jgi:plastocyanin
MSDRTRLAVAIAAIAGLSFTAIGIVSHDEARATPAVNVQQANPTITISNGGGNPPYVYSPTQTEAKVGQAITVTNKDQNGVHAVTAKDGSFSVDVPPNSSVTLTVSKAGNYPYYCTYHSDAHNAASLNVS